MRGALCEERGPVLRAMMCAQCECPPRPEFGVHERLDMGGGGTCVALVSVNLDDQWTVTIHDVDGRVFHDAPPVALRCAPRGPVGIGRTRGAHPFMGVKDDGPVIAAEQVGGLVSRGDGAWTGRLGHQLPVEREKPHRITGGLRRALCAGTAYRD